MFARALFRVAILSGARAIALARQALGREQGGHLRREDGRPFLRETP